MTTADTRSGVWVNWALALLTAPAAVGVVAFGFGALMGTDACSDRPCAQPMASGVVLDVLLYAAPVVAVLVIGASFVTARRPHGIVVPLCGWALLAVNVALLALLVLP